MRMAQRLQEATRLRAEVALCLLAAGKSATIQFNLLLGIGLHDAEFLPLLGVSLAMASSLRA